MLKGEEDGSRNPQQQGEDHWKAGNEHGAQSRFLVREDLRVSLGEVLVASGRVYYDRRLA